MAGWFYTPIPNPRQLQQSIAGPTDTSVGTANPITGSSQETNSLIVSSWGQESWGAQRGPTVAAQLATPQLIVQPVPHSGVRRLATIYGGWQNRDYALVNLPSGPTGIDVIAPPPPQAVLNAPYTFAAIRGVWPEEQWYAQAESTLASIFATPANQIISPARPLSLAQSNVLDSWPAEDWRGQSESAVAGGVATPVPAVLTTPQFSLAKLIAGGQIWPQEIWGSQTQPHTTAWLPPPITAIPEPVPHPEILSWPQEAWSAQRGATVAGGLATISQQIPPLPVGMLSTLVSSWPREQWNAQTGPTVAGYLAPVRPPTFVNNPPLQSAIFNQIIGLWPQPSWPAQTGDTVASGFAQTVTYNPVAPKHQIQNLWPQETWATQRGSAIASQFAQQQTPPLYIPVSVVGQTAALVSTWPRDDWQTQRAPQGAAWIQLLAPVAPLPSPPPHIERLLWQQEQWNAQSGASVASRLATVSGAQPSPPVQQKIVSIWAPESWSAQTGANVASQFALVFDIPFIPTPLRTTEILSWPQEGWAAQKSNSAGSVAFIAPVSVVPSPPEALQNIRFSWPQEDWNHQRGARGAAAFAKAPVPVPFIPWHIRAETISIWPRENWNAQSAPKLADLFAPVAPPLPPVPPVVIRGRPANLGYKVTTRTFNLSEMVSRSWGGEFKQPDHRVYEFSNGRAFDSTDIGTTGIYRKK